MFMQILHCKWLQMLLGPITTFTLIVMVGVGGFAACAHLPTTQAAPMNHQAPCHSIQLPVALTPGGTKQSTIFATFCQPQQDTSSTVIITYHGNSYAQYYWDFPYQPERYSFVKAMQEQGYAVLNMDRLAVDHAYTAPNPAQTPGAEVSMATDNFALHQVVQALRDGKLGATFAKVILAGHSLGGYLAWQAGKDYPGDFDGFIITGSTHPLSASATTRVIPLLVPAAQNPKFAQAGLDAEYFAYKAGTRSFYYYLPNADRKVIDIDNQLMQVTVKQELIDGIGLESTGVSRSIHVPVLVVLGHYDLFACEPDAITTCNDHTVYQAESPFYSPQACLQVKVIPNSGHDLNLQKNARVWYAAAGNWIDAFVVHHHHACGTRSAV